jgi:streptogrisin C
MKTTSRGLVVPIAVVLALAAPVRPVAAQPGGPRPDLPGVHPAVLLALQRDLRIDETTARRRLSDEVRAAAAEPGIARAVGPAYAGSWFDAATGKLVVAVTDAALAETVRARGARPEVVKHSHARLDAIKRHLDDLAGRRAGAAAGVAAWRVDPMTNRVVVTTLAGHPPGTLVAAARAHGDAVRFETTTGVPGAAADYVDGGERISSGSSQCSIGFNARLTYADIPGTSDPIIVTAGHCAETGTDVYAYGNSPNVGFLLGRWWLRDVARDWAIAGVTEPHGHWTQGPWVALHTANDDYLTVRGTQQLPLGSSVCKSGTTTKVTCGVIRARNESVYQADRNRTVTGLTRHTGCLEKGDSGGPNYSGPGQAQGISSTAALKYDPVSRRHRCLATFGQENQSWYAEITYIQAYTGARILTS